jgi:response regulator NasT
MRNRPDCAVPDWLCGIVLPLLPVRENPQHSLRRVLRPVEVVVPGVDVDWVELFDALPDPCLLLDANLVMVHANWAFTGLADKTVAEMVGSRLDQVFPVNPADPGAAERLYDAYRRVLRTGTPHRMGVVRYDVPNDIGGFDTRFWSVTLSAVKDSTGEVGYICHRASEVTEVHTTIEKALSRYQEQIADDVLLVEAESGLMEVRETAEVASRLLAEVEQMHEALESRAGIEQAKGIIMADRRCSAEEAFAVLRELSQHSNRKLRNVAEALVATATQHSTTTDSDEGRPRADRQRSG